MVKFQVIAITNWDVRWQGMESVYDSITVDAENDTQAFVLAKQQKLEWIGLPDEAISVIPVATQPAHLVLRYRNGRVNVLDSLSMFPADAFGLDVADVVKVTASGEYLDIIYETMPDVPALYKRSVGGELAERQDTVSWYGDMAKFIVGNLHV